MRPVSPDWQLLLACCRAHWRPRELDRPLPGDIDWNRLVNRAEQLGVAALLRATLGRFLGPTGLPPDVERRLDQAYYHQAARNARLGARLEELLDAFSRYGVPVIVLKGASLAELAYGNIALRFVGDIDVLVQPRDLDLAERLVRELGYVPDESSHPADWYRRCHHHLVPHRARDGSCFVEVHHHIFPPDVGVQVPVEDLWQRACPARLSVGPAQVLAPADLVLHLSVGLSAVQYFVRGLRTLCDMGAVIARHEAELNWVGLLESAQTHNLERHLYYGLWLARHLVAADVPSHVLETLRRSMSQPRVEEMAIKRLIRTAVFRYRGDRSGLPAELVLAILAVLLTAKGGRAKAAGLVGVGYRGLRHVSRRLSKASVVVFQRAIRPPPEDHRAMPAD